MLKLIKGIVDFRKNLSEENRELFAKLALGQKPDALFIGCSDSRVVPNLVASTSPGDVFVLRNIGNLIPPSGSGGHDNSAEAAIEFAVVSLNISDIIVCGHSECGAMIAIAEGVDAKSCPHLAAWLKHGKASLERVKKGEAPASHLSFANQISQMNVLQQIEHIKSYPSVKERLEKKLLRLHGWWFDIAQADVYCYEEPLNKFVLIDEKEADLIMARLV